jgi:hypothetical protein
VCIALGGRQTLKWKGWFDQHIGCNSFEIPFVLSYSRVSIVKGIFLKKNLGIILLILILGYLK